MLKCYRTNNRKQTLESINEILPDCWIDLSEPSQEEIDRVVNMTKVNRELIEKMLDDDELPRVETDKKATLTVIDVPAFVSQEDKYVTYPLGIIITNNNYVITVAPKSVSLLNDFRRGKVKDFRTAKKSRFLIQILNAAATSYLRVLDEIYRDIEMKEDTLRASALFRSTKATPTSSMTPSSKTARLSKWPDSTAKFFLQLPTPTLPSFLTTSTTS